MEKHDDDADLNAFLDAEERALAVHEAGHAVVARALGAEVLFVEIDLATGNGGSRSSVFERDPTRNLAVCVAGCRAELLLDAHSVRKAKISDFRMMRELLLGLPKSERRAARAEGYRLADLHLRANVKAVQTMADELLARRHPTGPAIIRIEGEELSALLPRAPTS